MTTAFIAGATGYTGRHVTERLAREGVQTVAHVRPDSAALGSWTARFSAAGVRVDATPWIVDDMARTMARIRPAPGRCRRRPRRPASGCRPEEFTH